MSNRSWLIEGRARWCYLAVALLGSGNAAYYVYTRAIVAAKVEDSYAFAVMLGAFESSPALLAALLAFYFDRAGRRLSSLLGLGGACAAISMGLIDVRLYPYAAFAVFLAVSSYQSVLYGAVLHEVSGRARSFGLFGAMGSLGWSVGGLLPGLIVAAGGGERAVFASVSALYALSSLVGLASIPEGRAAAPPSLADLREGLSLNLARLVALLLGSAGQGILISAAGVKLYRQTSDLLTFGAAAATLTGLPSLAARPIAGAAVDSVGPRGVLLLSLLGYAALALLLPSASGAFYVALWALPVYPFYEVSSYTLLSRLMPPALQATAAGLVAASLSISGLVNYALFLGALRGRGFAEMMSFSLALLAASAVVLAACPSGARGTVKSPARERSGGSS